MQGPQNHPQNAQKWVGLLLSHCFPKAHLHLSLYVSISLSLYLLLIVWRVDPSSSTRGQTCIL